MDFRAQLFFKAIGSYFIQLGSSQLPKPTFTMASAHVTARSLLSSFLPRLSAPTASTTSRNTTLFSRRLSLPFLPRLAFAIPSAIQLNVPGLLEGIWESILRAVPKKKTSHRKKRQRQLAGKAMKDVTNLNKCSVCGNVKRAHYLCPFCVKGKLLLPCRNCNS
jgi:large subunit ribosomal protein L32